MFFTTALLHTITNNTQIKKQLRGNLKNYAKTWEISGKDHYMYIFSEIPYF